MVQLIVFCLGDEDYGIRMEQVKEVMLTPEVAPMPKTPPFVKGIINLRGEIIAIFDLEERFRLRPVGRELPEHTYTLAVEAAGCTIGLLVRQMPRPLTLPLSQLEPAPAFVPETSIRNKYLEGIAKRPDGRCLMLLDMHKLLAKSEIMQFPVKQTSP